MCGRFTLTDSPSELLAVLGIEAAPVLAPRYNVAPTQGVAAVVNESQRRLELLHWGLVPSWAKDAAIGGRMINARVETLAEKPSFATPLKRRRCLVLADGFYEWRKVGTGKKPVYFRLPGHAPFAFAGLWETWTPPAGPALRSCAIVTAAASGVVATVHERMPVVLSRERYEAWLDPAARTAGEALAALADLPEVPWELISVSTRVNSPAYDGPECIAPAE